MAFSDLPNELLEIIIRFSVPESFESLALTCKHIHTLCTPLIGRHNDLTRSLRSFWQCKLKSGRNKAFSDFFDPYSFSSGFHLLAQIATDPLIARYMQHARFTCDGRHNHGVEINFILTPDNHDAVTSLLSRSPYLRDAGLDWEEYYTAIETDIANSSRIQRYSQHAAAFLLTLLPNVTSLALSACWAPCPTTDKLLDTLVQKARARNPSSVSPCDSPGLSLVRRIEFSNRYETTRPFDLNWATPFLALPCVRTIKMAKCIASAEEYQAPGLRYPYLCPGGVGAALEVVHFGKACIDPDAMTNFLSHTPRLKTLCYSHMHASEERVLGAEWYIGAFLAAIESAVGSHLLELSVTMCENYTLRGAGKTKMRGFQRLRKLALPLALALQVAPVEEEGEEGGEGDGEGCPDGLFLGGVVPPTVAQLSLAPNREGSAYHDAEMVFRGFPGMKEAQLPALREIFLLSNLYGEWRGEPVDCKELQWEIGKAGVALHMGSSSTLTWEGKEPEEPKCLRRLP